MIIDDPIVGKVEMQLAFCKTFNAEIPIIIIMTGIIIILAGYLLKQRYENDIDLYNKIELVMMLSTVIVFIFATVLANVILFPSAVFQLG